MDTQAFTKYDHQGKTPKQGGSIILCHSFTRIFALIYVSVNSNHYHAPGNPRANIQKLPNISPHWQMSGLIPRDRASLGPLILTNFTLFLSIFKTLIINLTTDYLQGQQMFINKKHVKTIYH